MKVLSLMLLGLFTTASMANGQQIVPGSSGPRVVPSQGGVIQNYGPTTSGTIQTFPQTGIGQAYPPTTVGPSYPQPSVVPSYPQPTVVPSYPQPTVVPSYPSPGVQPSYPRPIVSGPQVYPPQPQYPVVVTPNQFNGYNPNTGGINTSNTQIDNTAFDPYRNNSQFNGSKRWVSNRPIYKNGQIVGYQQGWVWNNSVTGQEHGTVKNFTPNEHGGVNEGSHTYSIAPARK